MIPTLASGVLVLLGGWAVWGVLENNEAASRYKKAADEYVAALTSSSTLVAVDPVLKRQPLLAAQQGPLAGSDYIAATRDEAVVDQASSIARDMVTIQRDGGNFAENYYEKASQPLVDSYSRFRTDLLLADSSSSEFTDTYKMLTNRLNADTGSFRSTVEALKPDTEILKVMKAVLLEKTKNYKDAHTRIMDAHKQADPEDRYRSAHVKLLYQEHLANYEMNLANTGVYYAGLYFIYESMYPALHQDLVQIRKIVADRSMKPADGRLFMKTAFYSHTAANRLLKQPAASADDDNNGIRLPLFITDSVEHIAQNDNNASDIYLKELQKKIQTLQTDLTMLAEHNDEAQRNVYWRLNRTIEDSFNYRSSPVAYKEFVEWASKGYAYKNALGYQKSVLNTMSIPTHLSPEVAAIRSDIDTRLNTFKPQKTSDYVKLQEEYSTASVDKLQKLYEKTTNYPVVYGIIQKDYENLRSL